MELTIIDPVRGTSADPPITNNFLFAEVIRRNKDLCIELLEMILGFPIRDLVFVNKEYVIDLALQSRGIRMDVVADDGEGTVFNVEMQNERLDGLVISLFLFY